MKKIEKLIFLVFILLSYSCDNNKNNLVGFYECELDGDKVSLSFYEDSTYMQSVINPTLGDMQFNGKFKYQNDTIYLIDDYFISNGKTISTKDLGTNLPEEEQNRKLKVVKLDDDILILRDARTQRVWEYHTKK